MVQTILSVIIAAFCILVCLGIVVTEAKEAIKEVINWIKGTEECQEEL